MRLILLCICLNPILKRLDRYILIQKLFVESIIYHTTLNPRKVTSNRTINYQYNVDCRATIHSKISFCFVSLLKAIPHAIVHPLSRR